MFLRKRIRSAYGSLHAFLCCCIHLAGSAKNTLPAVVKTNTVPCGRVKLAQGDGWRFLQVCGEERNAHWGLYHHEALAMPALAALEGAKRALILGGADGGVATQLLRSSSLTKVVLVSALSAISDLSQKHLPTMSTCFFDGRFEHIVSNPAAWLANGDRVAFSDFDLVVIERPYPGEMERAWNPPYEILKGMMSPTSLLVHYAASIWDMERVHEVFNVLSARFDRVFTLQYSSVEQIPWHDVAFVAGSGIVDVLNVDWSWWRAENISTISYHPASHPAFFVPAAIVSQTLGLQIPPHPDVAASQTLAAMNKKQSSSLPRSYTFNPEESRTGEVLCKNSSQYQQMEVIRKDAYEYMNLNDDLQFTSVFGDFYHESMVHPAMAALGRRGSRVLVLGGGDGGVATAVLRYPVEEVIHIEIDAMVVDASKKYFRNFATGFDDPRHQLIIGDALQWVHDRALSLGDDTKLFDLCVIDTTDDPLNSPWTATFYQDLKKLMAHHGVVVQNLGSMGQWLADHHKLHENAFTHIHIVNCNSPEYPSPYFIGLMTDALDPFSVDWDWWKSLQIETIYYHPTLHSMLFQLPLETEKFYASADFSWNPYEGEHLKMLDKQTRKLMSKSPRKEL